MFALIFDTVEPYVYEAVPIMFYPSGTVYEARFKSRHVDDALVRSIELFSQSEHSHNHWAGTDVLICLRASPGITGLEDDGPFHTINEFGQPNIIPLRLARIISISIVADFVLVRYQVAQYFNAKMIGKLLTDQSACRELNRKLYESGPYGHSGNLKHFFEFSDLEEQAFFIDISLHPDRFVSNDLRRQSADWKAVVSKMLFIPFLNKLPFLMFLGVGQVGEHGKNERLFDLSAGSLLFRSNKTYELKILEAYPSELNDLKALPSSDVAVLVDEKPSRRYSIQLDDNFFTRKFRQRAIGGYDFLEFSAPVRPNTHGNTGVIRFMIEEWSKNGGEPAENLISEQLSLTYLVNKGRSRLFLIGGIVLLFVAAIGSGVEETWIDSRANLMGLNEAMTHLVFAFVSATIYALGMIGVVVYYVKNNK